MGIDLDFGNVNAIPEEGRHRLTVEKVEIKEGSAGQYLNIEYSVENYGPHVWDILSLTPQSRWKLQEALEAITKRSWREDSMTLDPRDLEGLSVIGLLYHDVYEDKPRAKVKSYHRDSGEPAPSGVSGNSKPSVVQQQQQQRSGFKV